MTTYSTEVHRHELIIPVFSDACPTCPGSDYVFVPVATSLTGDQLTATYHHRACGTEWTCAWSAAAYEIEAVQ